MNSVAYALVLFALIIWAQLAPDTAHSILYLLQVIMLKVVFIGIIVLISNKVPSGISLRTLPMTRDPCFRNHLWTKEVLPHLSAHLR